MSYDFTKEIPFDERITIYCQLISQFETQFEITDQFETKENIEFAIVYPK
jgi:hypothetical protein